MPLLLRHLMPLIIIGAMLMISLAFTFGMIAFLSRFFRRPEREPLRGPVIDGTATEIRDEPAAMSPPAMSPPRAN